MCMPFGSYPYVVQYRRIVLDMVPDHQGKRMIWMLNLPANSLALAYS